MTVRIWNALDGTLHCILKGHGEILSLDFSPVKRYLAIGDGVGQVTIWSYS